IRWNTKMYNHAIEGDELQPLRARNINKLKPGVYVEKKLRLIVDSTGKRTWIFRFMGGTYHPRYGARRSGNFPHEGARVCNQSEPEACGWAKPNRRFLGECRITECKVENLISV